MADTAAMPDDDAYLADLAAQVLDSVGISPVELRLRLLPDRLRIKTGRVASINVSTRTDPFDGSRTIVFGPGFRPFVEQYARAFTLYLEWQHGDRADRRLRARWIRARSAMASEIDWCCSPAETPRRFPIPLTPKEESAAQSLSGLALRFVLCHEFGHVLLAHPDGVEDFKASQDIELEADQFALQAYRASLDASGRPITSPNGVLCFFHASLLLRQKLSLASSIKDPELTREDGRALLTHPPYVHRLMMLLEPDTADAWLEMRDDFIRCDNHLVETLDKQCATTRKRTEALFEQGARARPEAVLRLLDVSPTGVMGALYHAVSRGTPDHHDLALELAGALPHPFPGYLATLAGDR